MFDWRNCCTSFVRCCLWFYRMLVRGNKIDYLTNKRGTKWMSHSWGRKKNILNKMKSKFHETKSKINLNVNEFKIQFQEKNLNVLNISRISLGKSPFLRKVFQNVTFFSCKLCTRTKNSRRLNGKRICIAVSTDTSNPLANPKFT